MRELYQFDRYAFTGQTRDADAFTSGIATSGSGLVSAIWQDMYEGIHRDNLTTAEINAAKARGLDMSLYLPTGNEARIKAAYASRAPRLAFNIITPYSTYDGNISGINLTATMRWPFRNQATPGLFRG